MVDANEDRYAPPEAVVMDVATPGSGLTLASRWARLFAVLVDGIYLATAQFVLSKAMRLAGFTFAANGEDLQGLSVMEMIARTSLRPLTDWHWTVLTYAPWILLIYLLLRRSQTLGKMALGIRIVRPDGSTPSPGRLIGLRWALFMVVGLVPVIGAITLLVDTLMIFRSSRRCLHDTIADTIVVKV